MVSDSKTTKNPMLRRQIKYVEEIPTYVVVGLEEARTHWNLSSFFFYSIYDDYIIRLAWIVLWWQTKGSNHIIKIFISTSPIVVDDEDDGGDYDDDDDDDDNDRNLPTELRNYGTYRYSFSFRRYSVRTPL